jgi:hypothetical protein
LGSDPRICACSYTSVKSLPAMHKILRSAQDDAHEGPYKEKDIVSISYLDLIFNVIPLIICAVDCYSVV